MFSVTLGNTTIHFAPLIVFILAVISIYAICAIVLSIKMRKVKKNLALGNYDYVIVNGNRLLKIYLKFFVKSSSRSTCAQIEYLHTTLTIAYFSVSKYDLFLEQIHLLTNNNIKDFWMTLFYLQQNQMENAKKHYDNIEYSEDIKINIEFLNSVILNAQGDVHHAKNKMETIYKQLTIPVLKQIAEKIMNTN